ncbi:hypothetical protein BV25DRAFT_1245149 [Artomyces pyxidatus]|uniref:Uncharacterized protein n=1 Tax=Artomyces pyxidatus TaxID=48021 RepID=A0ACB8TEG9_9AGAM|nr:hypothetical protein BV25DRAFT_1245149 [Artomyces pyxidatus]
MRVSAGSLTQDDIPSAPRSASVFLYSLDDLAEFDRDIRAASRTVPYIGVSVKLPNESSKPLKIAFATLDEIYLLSLTGRRGSASHSRILQNLFTNAVILAGFEMAYTALLLCRALECDVAGFDLSTISVKVRDNSLTRPGALLYAKDVNVTSKRVDAHWEKLDDGGEPNIGLRAWYSAIAADLVGGSIGSASSLLRTSRLSESAKNLFTDLVSRCQLLDAMKPLVKVNDFTQANWDSKAGRMVIDNERFKTRVRRSETTSIEFQTTTGSVYHGTATGAEGRRTWVQGPTVVGDVKTIRVIGREEATNAEQARYRFLQHALEGSLNDLFDSFFIKAIWDPDVDHTILRERLPDSCRPSESPWPSLTSLNMSQFEVAAAMLSEVESSKLVVAHGPPGTGKTRTIGSATRVWSYLRQPVWIIAQSNVGVKNIAETLFKGDVGFRLVVSKEFYVEWHEDIYEEIKDNIIRSDEIPDDDSLQSIFDTTVVLCTMSTLSNPKLKEYIFEFMHLFHKFEKYLLKVCFFGDPKQLPPYGAEEAGLETIFDVKHLKKSAYFLNTQYRMPVLLGSFISTEVYNGKLCSEHNVKDAACILFVDVGKGEEQKTGNSYKVWSHRTWKKSIPSSDSRTSIVTVERSSLSSLPTTLRGPLS